MGGGNIRNRAAIVANQAVKLPANLRIRTIFGHKKHGDAESASPYRAGKTVYASF